MLENNYNEVLSKSRRKNFKSFDDDQKFQEFEIRKKDVIRVSEELTSLYADFLPNDFITSFNENLLNIKNSIDLKDLVKNIRKYTGSKLKIALEPAKQILDKDALMASSF